MSKNWFSKRIVHDLWKHPKIGSNNTNGYVLQVSGTFHFNSIIIKMYAILETGLANVYSTL